MRKGLKKLVAIVLTATMLMSIGMPAFAQETLSDEVYGKVTYYKTEEEVKELCQNNQHVQELLAAAEAENPNQKLVGVQVKEIYVTEKYAEDGSVLESRTLTEEEVKALENGAAVASSWIDGIEGEVGKVWYTLVAYDDGTYYRLYGSVNWTGYASLGDKAENPATGNDFITVSWGGNSTLRCPTNGRTIYGVYSDNTNIVFNSNTIAHSAKGFGWEFSELKNGKYAKDIQVNITLEKPTSLSGLETGAALTYVHTYKDTAINFMGFETVTVQGITIPIPLFQFGSSTAAWKDTISITGLLY